MIWLSCVTFLVALLGAASSQSVVVTAVPEVFNSPDLARSFLQCITSGIGSSPDFPSQEQQDLDDIAQVILSAVSSYSGETASARAQALSTAFASSLTDLIILDSAESNYNNQLSSLTTILSNCFVDTTGSNNPTFVSRIKSLISVLSQNNNAIPNAGLAASGLGTRAGIPESTGLRAGIGYGAGVADGSAYGRGISTAGASGSTSARGQSAGQSASRSGSQSSSSTTTTSTSGSQAASQAASQSASASQASASSFSQQSSASLASSSSFSSAFSSASSLSAVGNVGYQLGLNVANALGLGNAPALATTLQQAVYSVGVGGSPNAYANAVSNAVGQFLAGQGILTAANAGTLASSFANALSASAGSLGNRINAVPVGTGSGFVAAAPAVSLNGPFAVSGQVLPSALQTALAPVVSSSGLASSAASSRVSSLAQSIASAISSSGGTLSVPTFLNILSSAGAQVSALSSLNSSQITSQVLLEGIAALLQVINGAQISTVNLVNGPNVLQALVSALSS